MTPAPVQQIAQSLADMIPTNSSRTETVVPVTSSLMKPVASLAVRPKRGRRRKRPELNEDQRKQLRALQNREATRRSRERSRVRAEELKTELQRSRREKALLQAERDCLLANVAPRKVGVLHEESAAFSKNDSCQRSRKPATVSASSKANLSRRAMSLAMILNDVECDPVPPVILPSYQEPGQSMDQYRRAGLVTPTSKRRRVAPASFDSRPVSTKAGSPTFVNYACAHFKQQV